MRHCDAVLLGLESSSILIMREEVATVAQSQEDPARRALPALLVLLAACTGLVDAVSVLGLGKVFTANMTGNIVFLGFATGGAQGFHASVYIAALTAFLIGAALGGRLGKRPAAAPLAPWLLAAAMIEGSLLTLAALVATSMLLDQAVMNAGLYAVVALTAMAMGLRNATVRLLKVPDLTTTVLTMTLTGLAADSWLAAGDNSNWSRRIVSVLAMLIGATIGTALVMRSGVVIPLLLAAGLSVGGTLIWWLSTRAR